MLRTTVSRIKKVCVVAFVPRLLRGDQRCTASKFEIFSSAVLKKAQKSTKTTDEDEYENSEKHDGSQYKLVSEKESNLQKNNRREEEQNTAEEVFDENIQPIENIPPVPLRETPCQKCQRIIEQAFGKDDNLVEPILGEQYFSQGVNIEDTRQEIERAEIEKLKFATEKNLDKPISDDRVQFGVFQNRELSEQPLVDSDDLMLNESMLKVSGNIADINKNVEPIENLRQDSMNIHFITAQGNFCDLSEKAECIRQIESFDLNYSCKTDTEYKVNSVITETVKNENEFEEETLPLHEIMVQEEKFIREQELREDTSFAEMQHIQPMQPMQHMQHMHHNMQPMEHLQHMQRMRHIQQRQGQGAPSGEVNASQTSSEVANARLDCYGMPEQDEQDYHNVVERGPVYISNKEYKQDLNKVIDANDTSPLNADITSNKSVEFYVHNQEKLENNLNFSIRNFGDMKTFNATTASENEEQLTQKLEIIEETPLVEAHKPKLEGFNVTPRILGDTKRNVNCTGEKNVDNQQFGTSRVDVPGGSFDEVAKRCLDTPAGNIDEILLREMEKLGIPITSNRPAQSQGRTQLLDDDLVQMDVLKKQRKNPTDTKDLDLESHELERGTVELCSTQMYPSPYMCSEKVLPELDSDDIAGLHPNQVLIDPYDKKTIAYDTGEYDDTANYDPNKKFTYYYVPQTNAAERDTTEIETNNVQSNNVSNAKEEQINYAENDDKISSFDSRTLMLHKMKPTKRRGRNYTTRRTQNARASEIEIPKVSGWNMKHLDPRPEIEGSHNSYSSTLDQTISSSPHTRTESDNTEDLDPHSEIQRPQNVYASKLEQRSIFNPFKINELDHTRKPEKLDPHPEIQSSQNAYASKLDQTISFNPYLRNESDMTEELDPHPEIQRSQNAYTFTIDDTEVDPQKVNASGNLQEEEEINIYSEKQHSLNVYATEIDDTDSLAHQTVHASANLHGEQEFCQEMQHSHNIYATELDEIESIDPQNISTSENPQSELDYNRFVNATGIGKSAPINSLKVSELYDILDNEPLERHPEISRTMYIHAAGVDKTSSLDPYNVNASCCTWGDEKLDPHPEINHLLYLHDTGLDNAFLFAPSYMKAPNKEPFNTYEQDVVETNSGTITTSDQRRLGVPDTWDKTVFATKTSEQESYSKPNVSDGVWDEYLNQPKQDQKAAKVNALNDLWNDEQFDPNYVLTCNETCPISPKPHVCACETGRFADTEAIFDKEFTKSESEAIGFMDYSNLLTDLERGSHNDEPKRSSSCHMNMNKVSNLFKSDSSYQAASKSGSASMSTNAMPKLNEDVKLSELLRRVRERSRILECKNELKALGIEVEPVQGKCGRKAPRCPPTAPRSPPNNPVPPPSFGLPPLKPRPRACKPRRKPTNKCSSCDIDVLPGLLLQPMMDAQTPVACTEMVCEMNDVGTAGVLASTKSAADLTDEVIDRLQSLGKMLGGVLRKGKAEVLEAGCLMKSRRLCKILLARDYEPWAPIPSWPTPKKDEPKKPECSSGCRLFPPPRLCHDPPCEQKPCPGFPKRTFSLLDCFAVSLGENKVYDLGDF